MNQIPRFRRNYQSVIDKGVTFKKPSNTQQNQRDLANINVIMDKYNRTGLYVGFQNKGEPQYGDFSLNIDYREALDRVIQAEDQFEQLPAHVRRRFNDNPAEFYEFCTDPENMDEIRKLGLAKALEGVGTGTLLDVTVPTDTTLDKTSVKE